MPKRYPPEVREKAVRLVAAHRVCKSHTSSTGTFQSPNGGPLGYFVERRPRVFNRIVHRKVVPAKPADGIRGPVVTITLGDGGALLRSLSGKIDGLVVAGVGGGHVPEHLVPHLEALATTVPVVLASRTGAGSTLQYTYGFAGSEGDLLARGLISSGYFDPLKARILLYTLLAAEADR